MNILEEIPESTSTSQNKSFFSSNVASGPNSSPNSFNNNDYTSQNSPEPSSFNGNIFDLRNSIIVLLLIMVALTYFGINLLSLVGYGIQKTVDILSPFITQVLEFMGYSTGSAINTAADISADVAKEGVDIAEGAIQNVGNLLIGVEAIVQSQRGCKLYSGLTIPLGKVINPLARNLDFTNPLVGAH